MHARVYGNDRLHEQLTVFVAVRIVDRTEPTRVGTRTPHANGASGACCPAGDAGYRSSVVVARATACLRPQRRRIAVDEQTVRTVGIEQLFERLDDDRFGSRAVDGRAEPARTRERDLRATRLGWVLRLL